ncbi:MAG: single-stranded DNA-binding protein, partial [Spirochaetales bacterium]|nr:single-stranded DNA-binding protein [Spirochaetales bacterium]
MAAPAETLIALSRQLSDAIATLRFSAAPPGHVTHVYNPLDYARNGWEAYLQLAADAPRTVVLLGMNPGPWGMAQTG